MSTQTNLSDVPVTFLANKLASSGLDTALNNTGVVSLIFLSVWLDNVPIPMTAFLPLILKFLAIKSAVASSPFAVLTSICIFFPLKHLLYLFQLGLVMDVLQL